MRTSHPVLACAVLIAATGLARPASADPQIGDANAAAKVAVSNVAVSKVYEYRVEHPLYGDIGTYTNVVSASGDTADVQTRLNVVVKMLGIVVHRQEAERREHWQNDRLTLFHSVTNINGHKLDVDGVARGNAFVITSPAGTVAAPANVRPSNPWSPDILSANFVMSTKSGRVFKAHLDDVKSEVVTVDGKPERLRRFDVHTDKPQTVWLDEHDVPVAFRTEEDGTPIDFVLVRYPSGAPQPWPGPDAGRPRNDSRQQQALSLSP